MPTTKKASKTIDTDEMNGLLAEYKTLRDEILSAKGRRLQTVSLTVGAFGAILSIIAGTVLGSKTQSFVTRLAVSSGGSVALYYILSHSAQNWRFIFVLVPLLLWSLFLVMICKQPFQKDGSGNGKPTIKGPLPDKMRANKACTRLVGVGAFSGGLRGLELVPSKWRCLVPPTSG